MKLIYLIAGTYRAAGMERVIISKANHFAGLGHDVLIVTTEQRGRKPAFELNPGIRQIDLGIGYEDNNGSSILDKIIHYPVKQIRHRHRLSGLLMQEKADIVISTFCNDAAFVPKIKDGSHKLLEVHFSRNKRLQYGRKGLWRVVDEIRYRNDRRIASRYERFIVLTEQDASLWGKMSNLRVLPNACGMHFAQPAKLQEKQILAAGRYSYQKGFDMLLDAWERIDTAGWTLRIAGEGSLGDRVLPDNVVTGPAADMKEEYLKSSIFALSSRYEGLPMVLLEAQSAGLPAVSFDCQCGPRDVIEDGVNGLLVEPGNVVGFAGALEQLMHDDSLRRSMGAAAYRMAARYDESAIMKQWETMFAEL